MLNKLKIDQISDPEVRYCSNKIIINYSSMGLAFLAGGEAILRFQPLHVI